MRGVLNIIGMISVLYGISCFIQSYRHRDSKMALMRDGIFEDTQKTSRRLRFMTLFFVTIGLIMLFY